MRKGIYFIGDPCYVISEWDEFLQSCDFDQSEITFEWKGHQVWMANTAYGDGTYDDNHGHQYGVDAGLIGAIPIEVVTEKYSRLDELGRIVNFDHDFNPSVSNGVFHFGQIVIDTCGVDPEFYDYCFEEVEEDEPEENRRGWV